MKDLNKYFNSYKFRLSIPLILILIHSILFCKPIQDDFNLNGKRILFLGNSITQIGTYISFIDYYLEKTFPDKTFDIISIGLSSETVSGLTEQNHAYRRPCILDRLDEALVKVQPDIVISCYGMNDGIYHPQSPERFEAYKDGTKKLIEKVKSVNAQLILFTPPVFDSLPIVNKIQPDNASEYAYVKPYHKYDNVLADYSNWIMSLKINDVSTIDLHSPMLNFITEKRKSDSQFTFCPDGVHPSREGHLFMAKVFINGIGLQQDYSNLNSELQKISSDTLFSLIDKQRNIRSDGWLRYVGYTKEETVKTNEIEPVEMQVQELEKQIEVIKSFETIKPKLDNSSDLKNWILDGTGSWEISNGKLILSKAGVPTGPIRRPSSLAIFNSEEFKNVTIKAEIKSTADTSVIRRDLDFIVGYESPTRFYYIHLSGINDDVHNGIFLVNNSDRKRIDSGKGKPQLSDTEWHHVRVFRNGTNGLIEVYVDNSTEPVLTATDKTICCGKVGVGSFDDTGEFRNIIIMNDGMVE